MGGGGGDDSGSSLSPLPPGAPSAAVLLLVLLLLALPLLLALSTRAAISASAAPPSVRASLPPATAQLGEAPPESSTPDDNELDAEDSPRSTATSAEAAIPCVGTTLDGLSSVCFESHSAN